VTPGFAVSSIPAPSGSGRSTPSSLQLDGAIEHDTRVTVRDGQIARKVIK
jgi:hypothetical protein